MMAIRDASYMFQSILAKGNILAYNSFFEKKLDLRREYASLSKCCKMIGFACDFSSLQLDLLDVVTLI